MQNGGYSNKDQDTQITIGYLKAFSQIDAYISNTFKEEVKEGQIICDVRQSYEEEYEQEELINQNNNSLEFIEEQKEEDEDLPQLNNKQKSHQSDLQELNPQQHGINNSESKISSIVEEEQTEELLESEMLMFSKNTAVIQSAMHNIQFDNKSIDPKIIQQQIEMIDSDKHQLICTAKNYRYKLQPHDEYEKVFLQNSDTEGNFIFFNDWVRDEKTGIMYFKNKEIMEAQKRVLGKTSYKFDQLGFLMKKMGSNLMKGKSIMSISLPIDIFESRSNLERYAYSFLYAPTFLELCALQDDPVVQMQQSMVFLFTSSLLYLNLQKPFNPILGETFQAFIGGCPIYLEQISHHPPIASYQLYGRGYKFQGFLECVANMGMNSVDGHNFGDMRLYFEKTQNTIVMMLPTGTLQNTAYGERNFGYDGKSYFYDIKNNLFGEIIYCPDKGSLFGKRKTPHDFFKGGIYRMKNLLKEKLLRKYQKQNLKKFSGINIKEDVEEQICTVQGYWDQYFMINDKIVWDIMKGPFPNELQYEKCPLASDCAFRQDVLAWKTKDMKLAQLYKEKLETLQRKDRGFREKQGKQK